MLKYYYPVLPRRVKKEGEVIFLKGRNESQEFTSPSTLVLHSECGGFPYVLLDWCDFCSFYII